MADRPKVSVIVTFFNAERFIREAIQSVFAQTYGNWELLLVDDGSTDASTSIAREFTDGWSRQVHYLEHPGHANRGASASRNLGIHAADGEYIALLDSDDVWLPQKLEQQVAILQSQPKAAMVYGRTCYWHSWTGKPEDVDKNFIPEPGVPPDTLVDPPNSLPVLYPLGTGSAPCPSDLLVRRQAVETIGGFEEEFRGSRQLYDDQTFLVKMYLNAPVFAAGASWTMYRVHDDSCCAVAVREGLYLSLRLEFLRWLNGYLSKQGVTDARIRTALNRALWPYRHPILHRLSPSFLLGKIKHIARRLIITRVEGGAGRSIRLSRKQTSSSS